FCDECGSKTSLPDFGKPQTIGIGASPWLQREEAAARLRSNYETYLSRIKGFRRGWAMPRCYLSRLPEQAEWAAELIHDLNDAGVYVVEQAGHVQPDDFVIVLDTPDYQQAFQAAAKALEADAKLIRARWGKRNLISLALAGKAGSHEMDDCQPGAFCDDTHYPVSLFDLVLNLYAIPFAHAGFAPLRQALHEQWENTAARITEEIKSMAPKIFISYSHQDEKFKNELVKMLAGLQRRGVIDAWQDRRIQPGEEWFKAIKQALNECDMALLLVSSDFIASRFINDEELPDLLKRREKEGMIIIPIIVRDCLWQSEPVLKDLQALPTDGKAVITFSEATGDRDKVWTEIAQAIEKRAREKAGKC
ncbi:MAG: toll/interleukin-1 receptor domain-containing protein, partial [bacterium]